MIPTAKNIAKIKKEKLDSQKSKVHQKISNTFIESAIQKNNASAIKTIYYLASAIETIGDLKTIEPTNLISIKFDTREMLKYTGMKLPEVKRNLKAMQQTSITFIDESENIEEGINLLPYYRFIYGKHTVEVKVFAKIGQLIVDVKRNYSMINTKALMKFKFKHTLKMFPLLFRIANFSEDVAKRKTYELDELNAFFGTNYKKFYEIQRKILEPVKEELDSHSKLSFIYETNYDYFDAGRPKAVSITIDVIENAPRLF
ncbi:MAG TPA: RepB family plasmid replication initiator protein [Sulfurospirillum arcachonense]|nr:RepB family plasmid replication initiator protein [Sulfurospirillum arcachonense]